MDSVTFDQNSKVHVISFTTKEAVVFFFSQLTGLSAPAVTGYLKISQTGRFNGNCQHGEGLYLYLQDQTYAIVFAFILEFGTRQASPYTTEKKPR